jgi:O-antigen ligase
LFLLAFLGVTAGMFLRKDFALLKTPAVKKVLGGLAILLVGLLVATSLGYLVNERRLDREGVLMLGRFIEVGVIVLLAAFFQSRDRTFYKKVAYAQLSTLLYLPMLFTSQNTLQSFMPRFQLFENWPSNVGYYLVVSISFIIVQLLERLKPFRASFFLYAILAVGFGSILLWTQSRASWLATAVATAVILLIWLRESKRRIRHLVLGAGTLLVFTLLVFAALPRPITTVVLFRFFPQLDGQFNFYKDLTATPQEVLQVARREGLTPTLGETNRLTLWKIYSQKIAEQPLGWGVSYVPVNRGHGPQGPHNTILEVLMLSGLIGLVGFVYLFFLGFRNLAERLKTSSANRAWCLYLLASLVGLATAAFFDNMSTFRLMWVILGMAIFFGNPLDTTQDTRAPNLRESTADANRAS